MDKAFYGLGILTLRNNMDNWNTKSASINDFEAAVLSRQYDKAEQELADLIRLYSKDKIALTLAPFERKLTAEQSDLESYQVLEKLAYTITIWFSDKSWQPSANFYTYLVMKKHFINNVFIASSYHSTDHIVKNLGLLSKSNYSADELKRILLVFTLESDLELPWQGLLLHLPNETAQVITGLLASIGLQLSKRAQKNISALLDIIELLPPVQSSEIKNYAPLISAFFNCSSLADEKKYNLKKWIVKSIEGYVANQINVKLKKRVKTEVKKQPFRKDQTILFIHERYTSIHAMYRSWHAAFNSLKSKYKTVALAMNNSIDLASAKDFHQVITLEEEWGLEAAVEQVLKIRPDVIIYPSIGMSAIGPFLAAMRLAPIQIALPGHPSSSYLSTIDYFFVSREGMSDKDMSNILTEKWLKCPDGTIPVALLDFNLASSDTREDNTIKIAVNGVIQKVSNDLICMCKRISAQATKDVTFVFFMAHPKQGIEYFAAKSILRRFLPNSELHPFKDYKNYMSTLEACELAIPTFPFGGSNSNVDLIRVGVPKLFITNTSDLSGVSDLQVWKKVGEIFGYCESIDELEKRAVELINEPNLLTQFKEKIKAININSIDAADTSANLDERLSNAVTQVLKEF